MKIFDQVKELKGLKCLKCLDRPVTHEESIKLLQKKQDFKKRKTDEKEERNKTTNEIRDAKKIKRHVQGSKLINDGKTKARPAVPGSPVHRLFALWSEIFFLT